ncbi:MAG: FG-GAP-like repeat-containing protein, partial [Fervidobacterium sp.]
MNKLRFALKILKYANLVVITFNVLCLACSLSKADEVYAEYAAGIWKLQWSKVYGGSGHAQFAQPVGDLDGDGKNEVVVGGYETLGNGRCRILKYDGATGTYKEVYSWTHGGGTYNSPLGATILDLDGDGTLELVVSWAYSGSNDGVWAYKWDGTTLTPLDHWYGGLVVDVYSADIDGDGIKDVLVANAPWGVTYAQVVVLGWKDGHFVEKASWIHPSYTSYECMMLWTGDVNCDGKVDIVVSLAYRSSYNGGTWGLDWDPATNTWTHWPIYTAIINRGTHYGVVVGDVNGNGIPEIGIGNNPPEYTGAGAVLVEWDPTTSAYKKVWEGTWATEYGVIEAVAIGDADNDGNNEFVVGGGYVHIIGWDGTKYYEKATIKETSGLLSGVIIGDCDSDGKNELKACDIIGYGPGVEWIFKFERIDVNPPVTTHDYDGLWHTSDFQIKLNAADDLSGVRETFYRINSGPVKRLSTDGHPFITIEGANNTLEYWSVDNAGNEENHNFLFNIKLDKSPPWGIMTINGGKKFTNSTDVTLMLEYHDNSSGVVYVRFSNDGVWDYELWENVSEKSGCLNKSWSLSPSEGVRTVYCQLMDFVGFVSRTFNSSIILDVTSPKTFHDYNGEWFNRDFYINLTAYDNLGKTETFYRLNNGTVKNVALDGQPFITVEGENNTLEYWSVDEAGNAEKHNFTYNIKLDKTPPTIVFNLAKKTVEVGETIALDASFSYDVHSGISKWVWFFGDGFNETGPIARHSYSRNGTYLITLKVYDKAGNLQEKTETITVVSKNFLPSSLIL